MEFNYLTGAIESILFASGDPIDATKLAQSLETDVKVIDDIIMGLIDYYDENHDQKTLNVSFSSKDAKRLKTSQIHKKLDTLSY